MRLHQLGDQRRDAFRQLMIERGVCGDMDLADTRDGLGVFRSGGGVRSDQQQMRFAAERGCSPEGGQRRNP